MIGVKRMDKTWTDEFYREMDADKRLVLLKENKSSCLKKPVFMRVSAISISLLITN